MANAFVVSSLPAYVQENHDILLKNFALVGGATRSRMSIQTGIKYKGHINFLDLGVVFQSGTGCGFDPSSNATLTQREIECPSIAVQMDICPRTLIGKYAEYLVRNNATAESLPFEEYIMNGVVEETRKGIEKLIWLGDKSQTTDATRKWIDGLIKIATNDTAVIDVTNGGTSAYADIKAVYMALPEEVLERGAEIYVSPAKYRAFLQELVTANLFHYAGAVDSYPNEFILPGTDAKVVRTPGLKGSDAIFGTFASNLVYGTDMEGDDESCDLWYSKDDRVFKLEILFNAGVQIAFPNMVVLGA